MMSDKFKNCQENLELFAIDHEHFLTPFPLNLVFLLHEDLLIFSVLSYEQKIRKQSFDCPEDVVRSLTCTVSVL